MSLLLVVVMYGQSCDAFKSLDGVRDVGRGRGHLHDEGAVMERQRRRHTHKRTRARSILSLCICWAFNQLRLQSINCASNQPTAPPINQLHLQSTTLPP
ncbi:hypothetical protein CPB85DRAFT_1320102 [Mucidula mucida]|nr:hypothetical protein CPB85DRAFT_1320102 [Mucidula mucida]